MDDFTSEQVSKKFTELLEIWYKVFIHSDRPRLTGLHAAQYRLLSILYNTPMETMTNLGKTMYVSKQYMTNLVDSLIKEGYVERQSDPQDRRIIYVKITEAGQDHLRGIREQLIENVEERMKNFQPIDLELMSASIQNLLTISKKYL